MSARSMIIASAVLLVGVPALAAGLGDVDNQADVNHPDIHDKVGDGSNANPRNANADGGDIHGIANVPGQGDADPGDGEPGFADQLETVHGGIGDVNQNAE